MAKTNIFDLPRSLPPEELFETLIANKSVRIERIISTGQTTALNQWYDQDEEEWIILLQGEAILAYENGTRLQLKTGDYILIPAHQKHRVEFTSTEPPCIWLAVFYVLI